MFWSLNAIKDHLVADAKHNWEIGYSVGTNIFSSQHGHRRNAQYNT